jgi:hypothetical protein
MADGQNFWLKLYTDLLDHDVYTDEGFSDSSRVLVTAMWMYAARTGRHIFPADPKWLYKKIPWLKQEPDYRPLLEAKNVYGEPTPFVRYCDAPKAQDGQEREFEPDGQQEGGRGGSGSGRKSGAGAGSAKGRGGKKAKPKTHNTEEKREERREEKRESRTDTETLTGFGETNKSATLTGCLKGQSTAEQSSPEPIAATAQQSSPEPEKPENPMESEAGEAKAHIVPRPPPSVKGAGPQRLGQILCERFPDHWSDPDAEAFGWEIVEALGMPRDPHNMEIRSQWGAFASWWCRLKQAAAMDLWPEIRLIAVRKAQFVRVKARSARNKAAVWTAIMGKEMVHHGIHLPQARDGPATGVG